MYFIKQSTSNNDTLEVKKKRNSAIALSGVWTHGNDITQISGFSTGQAWGGEPLEELFRCRQAPAAEHDSVWTGKTSARRSTSAERQLCYRECVVPAGKQAGEAEA